MDVAATTHERQADVVSEKVAPATPDSHAAVGQRITTSLWHWSIDAACVQAGGGLRRDNDGKADGVERVSEVLAGQAILMLRAYVPSYKAAHLWDKRPYGVGRALSLSGRLGRSSGRRGSSSGLGYLRGRCLLDLLCRRRRR